MNKEQLLEWGKNVGTESRRTFADKLENGFFDKYMSGNGLEIGFKGYVNKDKVNSILPTAQGIDLDFPGYDGVHLPFENESQDFLYSSHVLEHIQNWKSAILEWMRVIKIGGHLIIVVPHQWLYEKQKFLPSKWNEDHKHYFTPAELMWRIEDLLPPNSYRVRMLEDGDKEFDYNIGPEAHSNGQYEITLVLQKIKLPNWFIK